MSNTTKKTKGHRFEKVTYHIPFYTSTFFEPGGEKEDGEVKDSPAKIVKIPMRIDANGRDERSNITNWELKGITHFDNNIENVLEIISQLEERTIKPRNIEDVTEEVKKNEIFATSLYGRSGYSDSARSMQDSLSGSVH